MELIEKILELLLGYKYRAVVLKYCGVQKFGLGEYIFSDTARGKAFLEVYLENLESSAAFKEYEVITFRSRNYYGDRVKDYQETMKGVVEDMKRGVNGTPALSFDDAERTAIEDENAEICMV